MAKNCIFQPELEAVIMANARNLIKRKKSMSNAGLYAELFGTGHGPAREYCRRLGIDPDTNETCFNKMMEHIKNE
jgi:hypothetical protein